MSVSLVGATDISIFAYYFVPGVFLWKQTHTGVSAEGEAAARG